MAYIHISGLLLGLVLVAVLHLLYLIAARLFFSSLAAIPGPKLAAATSWYECFYDVIKPAQYVFRIRDMHEQYGPIIRITPREISVSDPEFLDAIYAPGQGLRRDKDLEKVKALGINTSVGGAVQHDLHRRRREALNPYFSQKSVLNISPQIVDKASHLGRTFLAASEDGHVINLSDIYFAFASDIVSQYSFGHNANVLQNLRRASEMRNNVAKVLRGVKFNLNFSWVRALMRKLPPSIGARFTPQGIRDMIQFRMRIRKEIQQILDNDILTASHDKKSVFYELRDSPSLPMAEKSVQRLEDEGTLLVMAGTESTAKSITLAHYHLLANPEALSRLRQELRRVSEAASFTALQQIPYLNAIIQEAHRLSFGLTGRNPRVSPNSTISYTDPETKLTYSIPPGTPISASTVLIHTNPKLFPDPWNFKPERWLDDSGSLNHRLTRYNLAFGKGPRQCIGMHLANAEMAIAIAEMARWDMQLFETYDEDVRFLHDYHVATPRLDSKGVRAKVMGSVVL